MEIEIKAPREFADARLVVEITTDGSPTEAEELAKALTLTTTSREFNRRRVEELEDVLHQVRRLVHRPPIDSAMAARNTASLDGYGVIMGATLAALRDMVGGLDGGLSTRLYTAEEVGEAQASEAELVATPLRRKVAELEAELARLRRGHVCTDSCQPNAHVAFTGAQVLRELEQEKADETERADKAETALIKIRAEREELEAKLRDADRRINALTGQVRGYDHDRHTERDRADRMTARCNQWEADITEERAEHRRSLAARDQLLSAATTRVKLAREALDRPVVVGARNEIVTSKGAILADAIGEALAALDA